MIELLLLLASAVQQPAWPPPGMSCQPKTVFIYSLGPNSANAHQYYDKHVAFVADQLRKGTMMAAGPMTDGQGLVIYNTAKAAEAEAVAKQDPFIANNAMTFKSYTWQHCVASK